MGRPRCGRHPPFPALRPPTFFLQAFRFCVWVTMLSIIALGSFLAAFSGTVSAQTTTAQCEQGFEWMFNSKAQSPCLVASYLFSACEPNPSDAFIQALVPNDGDYYSIPQTAVSPCFCNTVFYSVIGACSYCQGDVNLPWSTYQYNCTTSYVGLFPLNIPKGTAVPAWAYMDVVTPDMFNKTAAQQLALQDKPDSLAPDSPQSTAPFITSFTPTASATLTEGVPSGIPTVGGSQTGAPTTAQKSKTNVGAIVGGVVGGVGGLLLIGALLFWFLRRKRTTPPAQPELYQPQPNPAVTPQMWSGTPAPPPSVPSNPFTSPTPSFAPTPQEVPAEMRPYNPEDPSTFPTFASSPSTSYAPMPPHSPQPVHTPQPGAYSGVPEL